MRRKGSEGLRGARLNLASSSLLYRATIRFQASYRLNSEIIDEVTGSSVRRRRATGVREFEEGTMRSVKVFAASLSRRP